MYILTIITLSRLVRQQPLGPHSLCNVFLSDFTTEFSGIKSLCGTGDEAFSTSQPIQLQQFLSSKQSTSLVYNTNAGSILYTLHIAYISASSPRVPIVCHCNCNSTLFTISFIWVQISHEVSGGVKWSQQLIISYMFLCDSIIYFCHFSQWRKKKRLILT